MLIFLNFYAKSFNLDREFQLLIMTSRFSDGVFLSQL